MTAITTASTTMTATATRHSRSSGNVVVDQSNEGKKERKKQFPTKSKTCFASFHFFLEIPKDYLRLYECAIWILKSYIWANLCRSVWLSEKKCGLWRMCRAQNEAVYVIAAFVYTTFFGCILNLNFRICCSLIWNEWFSSARIFFFLFRGNIDAILFHIICV